MNYQEQTMHFGLIGYGYWGTNLLRNINENNEVSEFSVCDIDETRLNTVKKLYPGTRVYTNSDELFEDKNINAVIIATPPACHFQLAQKALLSGKHVLVEKPICSTTNELNLLIEIAEHSSLVLMVDHTFLYNPAIQHIKNLLDNESIGAIKYIDFTRINLGIYQQNINVIWDLACHDLSIINFLIRDNPTKLRAIVQEGITKNKEDIAYIFLYYASNMLIQINCSWASPVKIRQMIIGAEHKMIIYDDIEPTQKIKIYDYEKIQSDISSKQETLIDYRLGDIHIPKLSNAEPLKYLIEDFIHCIQTGDTPVSNAQRAMTVIYLLEKIEESIQNNGNIVELL